MKKYKLKQSFLNEIKNCNLIINEINVKKNTMFIRLKISFLDNKKTFRLPENSKFIEYSFDCNLLYISICEFENIIK